MKRESDDAAYFRRRAEGQAAIALTAIPLAADVHRELARLYAERADILQRETLVAGRTNAAGI